MTRINVGVKPQELPDKLLLAEHREIKRIPNCILKGRYNLDGIPNKFTLGKGHVKFFYDKIEYLHRRYVALYVECTNRKFQVQAYTDSFFDVKVKHPELYNNWFAFDEDRQLIIERIKSKGFKPKEV